MFKIMAVILSALALLLIGLRLAIAWYNANYALDLNPAAELAPCPASPNCVSSMATDDDHTIEPLRLAEEQTLADLIPLVTALPGAELKAQSDNYVYVTFKTRWLGFVDDLQLRQRPDSALVDVRSASRLGTSDLGVNRKRIETIRLRL